MVKGLCLWHKHMSSKLWDSMKLEGLRFIQWWLVNYGANDVNQDYSDVGFDLVDNGGQGGEFNAPWEAWEEFLKCCVGFVIVPFGLSMVEFCGLMLPGASCVSHVAKPTSFSALSSGK